MSQFVPPPESASDRLRRRQARNPVPADVITKLVVIGLAIVFLVWLAWPSGSSRPRTADPDRDAELAARAYLRQFVRDASFPVFGHEVTRDARTAQWRIRGQVEGTNAFGARLTEQYKVRVRAGRDGKYHLVYCEVAGTPLFQE